MFDEADVDGNTREQATGEDSNEFSNLAHRGYKQGRKRVLAIVAGILGQHLKTTGEPLVQPLMRDGVAGSCSGSCELSARNHGLITGWRIFGILSITMKMMLGTWGLEPQTSTVSILRSTT